MNESSFRVRLYLALVNVVGALVLLLLLRDQPLASINWGYWFVFALFATAARIYRVEGPSPESSYNLSWFFYFAAFILVGPLGAALVILTAQLVEFLFEFYRPDILVFNLSTHMIALGVAGYTYSLATSDGSASIVEVSIGLVLTAAVFTLLVFLVVNTLFVLGDGHGGEDPGIFRLADPITGLCLLSAGGATVLLWKFSPWTIIWALIPLYLYYRSLSIPRLMQLTNLDLKTGLYNSQYFKEAGQHELTRSARFNRPLSVIMADLDLLRNINNSYGHLAGDIVLKGMAEIFRREVREYDIVCRFGGEEFSILLPETAGPKALLLAERIRQVVGKQPFRVPTSKAPIYVTLSLGVAAFPDNGHALAELIHAADLALYLAKLEGRNRAYIASAKSEALVGDRGIAQDLANRFNLEVMETKQMEVESV